VCRASIAWALDHREEVMSALLAEESRTDLKMSRSMLDEYLRMYANADTRELPADARLAVSTLLEEAFRVGLVSQKVVAEFAP
jgi:predicted solute-binding protein